MGESSNRNRRESLSEERVQRADWKHWLWSLGKPWSCAWCCYKKGSSNSLADGLLSPMGEVKGLAAQSKPKGCFGVFFAAWVICRAVKTIVSILNLRKMAWDCVAGSLAARWHAWMTH